MRDLGTLLFVVNVDWYLISHRIRIVEETVNAGWNVYVACEDTGRSNEIENTGAKFIHCPISRSGTNPLEELRLIRNLYKLYKKIKPDVVHHISLKPVIYGSFVAKRLKIKGVLNAVSGLGYVFTDKRTSWVQKVMLRLMKYSFNRKNVAFIFQNQDDYNELKELGVLTPDNIINFIKGSGVNLSKYSSGDFPSDKRIKILLPSRMLWDKGVAELREATQILKENYSDRITFVLAGMVDDGNKASVQKEYLHEWEEEDYVTWIDHQKDMVSVFHNSHIVVLPSYREGMPKSLIEACATGRPIITTTAVGCKECVDEGVNGFLVPVKNGPKLAEAISKLVDDKELRIRMGIASRKKAEKEFDLQDVIRKHLKIYTNLSDN